ncbi:hypothetical protein [Myxococcus stipitatus]|uniref:hypothetical protein n=1 Tax=Myxococcus stipitatus TaxID=83455 RepID=UPI0002FB316C|nr:hypothetical protein [Myxococcus stipitatus]
MAPVALEAPQRFDRKLTARRLLITSAQNATPVHAGLWAALRVAAKHLRAELVVVPLRYRNPTSQWTQSQDTDEWWAPEVVPYLCNTRQRLGPHLVLAADVKTQPTARDPLAGFESLTGGESCLIGHTKMALRSVPVPSGRTPKILSTTGACTVPNFTDTKAGAIGAFHHYLGAVVVELDGSRFHLRQLNADRETGEFIDLATLYTSAGVRKAPPALGLVMGDTHARFACPAVDRATFGPAGIVDVLNPRTLVWHDILDGYSVNPHHHGDPFIAAAKSRAGLGDVRAEVEHAVRFVADRTRGRQSVLVDSNHGDFLARWVRSTDWRHDTRNAAFYLETARVLLESATMTGGGAEYADAWAYWVAQLRGDANIRCLGRNESLVLGESEVGMHGHRGPNGARGSLRNLSRLGSRVISGHSHTPGVCDGHYQCGTSTPLRLEYTAGPGGWLNTHCAVYATGARALLTVIDGAWRLD